MKSKNPWYTSGRGGFQTPFNPRRPKSPSAYDTDTGQKLWPLNADQAMAENEQKLKRQDRDNSGSAGLYQPMSLCHSLFQSA